MYPDFIITITSVEQGELEGRELSTLFGEQETSVWTHFAAFKLEGLMIATT